MAGGVGQAFYRHINHRIKSSTLNLTFCEDPDGSVRRWSKRSCCNGRSETMRDIFDVVCLSFRSQHRMLDALQRLLTSNQSDSLVGGGSPWSLSAARNTLVRSCISPSKRYRATPGAAAQQLKGESVRFPTSPPGRKNRFGRNTLIHHVSLRTRETNVAFM